MGCRQETQFMLIFVAEEELFSMTSTLVKGGYFYHRKKFLDEPV